MKTTTTSSNSWIRLAARILWLNVLLVIAVLLMQKGTFFLYQGF